MTITIDVNGINFSNNLHTETSTITSGDTVTINKKRIKLSLNNISLSSNESFYFKLSNTEIDENDSIILNLDNDITFLFFKAYDISSDYCFIKMVNLGTTDITNETITLNILVAT